MNLEWLKQPPNYTTFRVNKLKNFDPAILENYLRKQATELKTLNEPKFYFIKPDCVVIERWPANVTCDSDSPAEVIVDAACAAAVLRGAHVFAPGVMGLPTYCAVGQKVKIYGDLSGECLRGLKVEYKGKKIFAGIGYLKMTRSDLFDNGIQPSGIAVHTILPASRIPVVNETLYPEGTVLLQNLPSIVCGWVVDARLGELILDMCAAPGNKTTHLAEMSSDQATIIAIDKTPKKVDKIRETCKVQEVTCVTAYSFDSTKSCSESSVNVENGPPFPPNSFDKILLDGPCSGLGQRPLLHSKMTLKMVQSFKFVQRKLFLAAARLLKPGGRLVYSTCTVTKEENEEMVVWALSNIDCLRLVSATPLHGGPGLRDCGLSDEQRIMVQRFGPEVDPLRPVEDCYRYTIGFFIAAFTKT